jgi:membrane fusion protein, macrolide-specific efflux system
MLSKLVIAIGCLKQRPDDFAPNGNRLGNVGANRDRPGPFPPGATRTSGPLPGFRIRSSMWFAVVAAVGASLLVHLNLPGAEADPAPAGQDSGFPLTRGPFEVVIASHGVIQPFEVVDVGAQVSGQLSSLRVKLGDRVETGRLLAEIDDQRIRARLAQGEAAIDTLRAQISAKQAQHAHARLQQARTDALSDRNIASRAQTELVQMTTTVLAAEVRALEAQLAGQEAAVEGIRHDLSHTRITAPVDGVVTAIVAQRGRTLNANQQTPVILRISRIGRSSW